MVRQLSIDQFENESRRVSMGTDSISKALPSPMFERNSNEPCVSKVSLQCFFCRTVALRTSQKCLINACVALRSSQGPQHIKKTQLVLRELLHPRTWKPSEDRSFLLSAEQINQLCDTAESIFREEPSVLQLQGESFALLR